MKNVYIVLAHTGTLLSRLIKIKTGAAYTHSSIAIDDSLKPMYSFGRLNPYNAFIGGFVEEGADVGTFKRFYNTEISIFKLEVSDESYEKIEETINYMKMHRTEYKFNILGMFLAGYNIKRQRNKKYYCAEFVRAVLAKADVDLTGIPETIKPEHFKNLKNAELIYTGLLRTYNAEVTQNKMKKLTDFLNAKKVNI